MSQILILGAGKSSTYLLEYLNQQAPVHGWKILACDKSADNLKQHTHTLENVTAVSLDVNDPVSVRALVRNSLVVVSLLPPVLHASIAEICLEEGRHLATASYVSPEMRSYHQQAAEKKLIFLNELGLDPGIDHLSAMKMLDDIRNEGGRVTSFESYCGGLVLEEDCVGNPWKYKFTWNPMNVITAGQGGMSVFRQNGEEKYIPWHRLFAGYSELAIEGYGLLDAYANRDSLGYTDIYGLQDAETILRGTLRRQGFCRAWQALVQAGFTENNTLMHPGVNSIADLSRALLGKGDPVELLVNQGYIQGTQRPWFQFLNLDDNAPLTESPATSAMLLRLHLEKVWKLQSDDRDEVIMYHRIKYTLQDSLHTRQSVLKVIGMDQVHTAMSKTVGLPLAMGVEMIFTGEARQFGVVIPASAQWYRFILPRLEKAGIAFQEY